MNEASSAKRTGKYCEDWVCATAIPHRLRMYSPSMVDHDVQLTVLLNPGTDVARHGVVAVNMAAALMELDKYGRPVDEAMLNAPPTFARTTKYGDSGGVSEPGKRI